MRHRKGNKKLGRPTDQRLALLRTQATQLFRHGRIMTTVAKAKALIPFAEKLIHKAKAGDVHSLRQVRRYITDRDVIKHLVTEVVPKVSDKDGGYITAVKGFQRQGDGAPMALVKLNIQK
jgi:large subunit ribosomal protein L17